MKRHSHSIDPDVERELAALEAALAGDPGTDPALAALVADARAVRPQPAEAFARCLDARAAAGFAPQTSASSTAKTTREKAAAATGVAGAARAVRRTVNRLRATPRRALLPALGVAASMILAVAVGVSLVGSDNGTPMSAGGDGAVSSSQSGAADQSRSATPKSADSGGGTLGTIESSPPAILPPEPFPTDPGESLDRTVRRVERRATLSLAVPGDKVQGAATKVITVTDGVGGIVLTSSIADGTDAGGSGATFELRIPTNRLGAALARLSAIGTVRSRTQTSADITGAFVPAQERLTDARAERATLLRLLAKADTANETASIRARLRIASTQIAGARAELSTLRQRTDFSAVSVTVSPKDGAAGATGGGGWTPRDALNDAVRVLELAAGITLVALAVALPLGLLALAGAFAGRSVRRRRRERALGAA